ncbi:MAG: TerB N-terminal domain-containing protein [Lachnospiraceae bacterium]|jgi:hypothetical protein
MDNSKDRKRDTNPVWFTGQYEDEPISFDSRKGSDVPDDSKHSPELSSDNPKNGESGNDVFTRNSHNPQDPPFDRDAGGSAYRRTSRNPQDPPFDRNAGGSAYHQNEHRSQNPSSGRDERDSSYRSSVRNPQDPPFTGWQEQEPVADSPRTVYYYDDFQLAYEQSVPARIREMRRTRTFSTMFYARPIDFYRQGMLMADYEDDCSYSGYFVRRLPTYQDMTDIQLRGYFTWRTRLRCMIREGNVAPGFVTDSLSRIPSFILVWIYELINNIGVSSPEEGIRMLRAADRVFGQGSSELQANLRRWTHDYVIANDLPAETAEDLFRENPNQAPDLLSDFERLCTRDAERGSGAAYPGSPTGRLPKEAADTILDPEKAHPIFQALCEVSRPDPTKSALWKKYPADLEAAAVWAYGSVSRFLWLSGRYMPVSFYFGGKVPVPYHLFESAVYYDAHRTVYRTYTASTGEVYECRDGGWTREGYQRGVSKSTGIGAICHDADSALRIRLNFAQRTASKPTNLPVSGVIPLAVDEYLAAKKEASRPKVHIDLSKLDTIRREAAVTRDRLIVDEEPADVPSGTQMTLDALASGNTSPAPADLPAGGPAAAEFRVKSSSQADASPAFPASTDTSSPQVFTGKTSAAETPADTAGRGYTGIGHVSAAGASSPARAGSAQAASADTAEYPRNVTPAGGSSDGSSSVSLSAEQREFLTLLLRGADAVGFAKERHIMLSALVDSINEAFYDEIGDSVLEISGDTPQLIEDYRNDVEDLLGI